MQNCWILSTLVVICIFTASGCNKKPEPIVVKTSVVVESSRVVEFRKMLVELSWSGLPLLEQGEIFMSRMRLLEFTDPAKRSELIAKGEKMVKSVEPETIKQLAQELLDEMPEPAPANSF